MFQAYARIAFHLSCDSLCRLILNRTLLCCNIFSLALVGVQAVSFTPVELLAQTPARPESGELAERFGQITSVPAYILRTYQFAAEEGKTRVHVRFGIVNDVLQFTQDDDHFRAAYEVNLTIVDREQNLAASRIWKRGLEVADFALTNDRQQLNEESADFTLAPGVYDLRVEISDVHTQRRLRRTYPLTLPDYDKPRLQLSTLAFGERFTPPDSLQYNLLAVLTDANSSQGVCYEIYGVQPGDTLRVQNFITDWKQEKLEEWHTTIVAASTRVRCFEALHGRLKYQGLQRLRVTVSARQQQAEAEADYRVQFTLPAEQNIAQLLQEYPGLAYLPLRYIASSKEFKRMSEASHEERERLVAEFWQQRDPSPNSGENELREEFYRRVAFAQMRFALHGLGKAGWETDRGRIYIVYGPPQEVHHQMGELDPMPYEIWFYPKAERRFVFMDKKGSGEYELVNR